MYIIVLHGQVLIIRWLCVKRWVQSHDSNERASAGGFHKFVDGWSRADESEVRM